MYISIQHIKYASKQPMWVRLLTSLHIHTNPSATADTYTKQTLLLSQKKSNLWKKERIQTVYHIVNVSFSLALFMIQNRLCVSLHNDFALKDVQIHCIVVYFMKGLMHIVLYFSKRRMASWNNILLAPLRNLELCMSVALRKSGWYTKHHFSRQEITRDFWI